MPRMEAFAVGISNASFGASPFTALSSSFAFDNTSSQSAGRSDDGIRLLAFSLANYQYPDHGIKTRNEERPIARSESSGHPHTRSG